MADQPTYLPILQSELDKQYQTYSLALRLALSIAGQDAEVALHSLARTGRADDPAFIREFFITMRWRLDSLR